jgi:glutamate-ammonia-ligase adenylyltransferase
MRDKMRSEHNASSNRRAHFDLKRDPGGIVDIEFVVQYLVLAHAGEHAELTNWSDVIRLLEALEQTGLIAANEAKMLSRAYLDYRSATHSLGLQGRAAETDAAEFEAQRQQVKQITEALLPGLQAG